MTNLEEMELAIDQQILLGHDPMTAPLPRRWHRVGGTVWVQYTPTLMRGDCWSPWPAAREAELVGIPEYKR